MAKVLVVDDQHDVREIIAAALEDRGVEAVLAANGRAALMELARATVEDEPFDVMLLDIVMPGVDGWRVLAAVKANPLWEDLPIIVITGQATSVDDITRVSKLDGVYAEKGADFLKFVVTMVDRLTQVQE
jgi:CheY-like chemotaxis protein